MISLRLPKDTCAIVIHLLCLPFIKFSLPSKIKSFATICMLYPLFIHCPDSLLFCPDPCFFAHQTTNTLLSQRLRHDLTLSSKVVKMHWFKGKEKDVLVTIALTLLPHKRNWWQIITMERSHGLVPGGPFFHQRPFQVADRWTGNGWHCPAARQSWVRFPVIDTDAGP